jgi:hypothetical protein
MITVNKPEVSRATAYTYGVLFVFIVSLVVFFSFAAFLTPLGVGGIIASIVSAFVGVVIGLILMSLYRTRYVLTDKDLIIRTTKLIGGSKIIPLKDVKSVEKTLIPFGIRLFGASFHGGYYHIPNLGRAFLTITNFKDGLLIETSQHKYIITPSDPEKFKALIEKSKG